MRSLNTALILLGLFTALTSKAQPAEYTLLIRGQPSPYDTAVAIQVKQYRREGAYMRTMKEYCDSLNSTISEYRRLEGQNKAIEAGKDTTIRIQAKRIDRLMVVNDTLRKENNYLYTRYMTASRPPVWYRKPETWGIAGIIFGILIKAL